MEGWIALISVIAIFIFMYYAYYDDFNDFYSDFVDEVREFKLFNPDDDYTKWKKAGQTWYWIPLDIVPGCEENF